MEHDFSLQVEDFKKSMTSMVNHSNLPPAMLYYISKDIFQEIEKSYFQYLDRTAREEAAAAAHQAQMENAEPVEGEVIEN